MPTIRVNRVYGLMDGYAAYNWQFDITSNAACAGLLTPRLDQFNEGH